MRIKFYSASDMSSGWHLEKAEKLRQSNHIFGDSINDVIEKYHISQYVCGDIEWSIDTVELRQWATPFMGEAQRWFNTRITDDTILQIISELDRSYLLDFWVIFEKQKLYKKISKAIFTQILYADDFLIEYLLQQRKTCAVYDDEITKFFEETHQAKMLISIYDKPETYYLPKGLSNQDIDAIFIAFIASENPHVDTLRRIQIMKPEGRFQISDYTRYQAKQKYIQYWESSENKMHYEHGVQITYSEVQTEIVTYRDIGSMFDITYSAPWIHENLDYPTLLNNFIYMFGYADIPQMRMHCVRKRSDQCLSDLVGGASSKYGYKANTVFRSREMFEACQIISYYQFLERHSVRLEDIILWFFQTYLPTEFGADVISVRMPNPELNYCDKCTLLITVFDSIAKQYKCYIEKGHIDSEYISFSNTPVLLEQVPSQIAKKYVYGTGQWFNATTGYMFSNQSSLNHTTKFCSEHASLYDLISKESVSLSDYLPYQQAQLNWLLEQKLIAVDTNEIISITDKFLMRILHDLYHNDVISRHYYNEKFDHAFRQLEALNVLSCSSMLLSNPELDYFSFYLDDRRFDNGYKIRNSYAHGVSQVITDENIHHQNYFTLLRLLILLIIKINDDFCLAEALKQQSQSEI